MLSARDEGDGTVTLLPAAPLPPYMTPAPPPPPLPPVAPSPPPPAPSASSGVNANGETLAQAEAAIRAEVAAGVLPAIAIEHHPLPPGSVTATQALDFLASLPQSVSPFGDPSAGVVTGPPIDSQPGYDPVTHSIVPGAVNPPEQPSVDVGGTGDGGRELESAYRPAGVVGQWRNIVDVFKLDVPQQHAKVKAANAALIGVFK